mmetsp:Transcript_26417/g.33275  ORF Transcript_26417/g.33275 Transcript_26417/m.33275 type:complete len:387 (-) Transcript_26417:99-1259(-)
MPAHEKTLARRRAIERVARTVQVQKAFESNEFSVEIVPADGDCWYNCIARALGSDGSEEHTISTLRERIAEEVSDETVQIFRIAHDAGLPGYEFMRRATNAETVRGRMRLTSRQVGSGRVLWANDFEVRTTANVFRCVLLLYDMEARKMNSFIRIEPEVTLGQPSRFIVLQRTKRQHYNLVLYRGRKIGPWPPPEAISRLWNIDVSCDHFCVEGDISSSFQQQTRNSTEKKEQFHHRNVSPRSSPRLSSKRSRECLGSENNQNNNHSSAKTNARPRSSTKKIASANTVLAAPSYLHHYPTNASSSSPSIEGDQSEQGHASFGHTDDSPSEDDAHTANDYLSRVQDNTYLPNHEEQRQLPRRSPRFLNHLNDHIRITTTAKKKKCNP